MYIQSLRESFKRTDMHARISIHRCVLRAGNSYTHEDSPGKRKNIHDDGSLTKFPHGCRKQFSGSLTETACTKPTEQVLKTSNPFAFKTLLHTNTHTRTYTHTCDMRIRTRIVLLRNTSISRGTGKEKVEQLPTCQ